ncbi:hypothetical protein [Prescottella equi]|uniref:hypothetical protein n=1 Tax=Rhodococcus hoagii TaxID=43767 RepID=UPI001EEC5929|nr:hypothetical protein [Prescottella equi]
MNPSRYYVNAAAQVLTMCASYDPWFPKPPEQDAGPSSVVYAWAGQFERHKLTRQDLLAGVSLAYDANGSGFKPLPADIIGFARKVRRERANAEGPEARAAREAALDAKLGERPALDEAPRVPMPDHIRQQMKTLVARTSIE